MNMRSALSLGLTVLVWMAPALGAQPTVPTPALAAAADIPALVDKAQIERATFQAPTDRKVGARLREVRRRVAAAATQRAQAKGLRAPSGLNLGLHDLSQFAHSRVSDSGEIQVYVRLDRISDDRLAQLTAQGLRIELANGELSKVQGWVAHDRLSALAALAFVQAVQLPSYGVAQTGSVVTQGDALLQANLVRSLPPPGPYTGLGVRVGVISDGADHRSQSQATGDLPKTITINPSHPGSGDEGTAMMEIVHDLAPDAALYFGGPNTTLDMINIVNWMATTGQCRVISDDLEFFTEPFFEDGDLANAYRNDITQNGVVHCSAAGNDADSHYYGVYRDSTDSKGIHWHNFSAAGAVSQRLRFDLVPGASATYVLQWDDAFNKPTNDYDLYMFDSGGNQVAFSADLQNGGANQQAIEIIDYTNFSPRTKSLYLGVLRYSATANKTLDLFGFGGGVTFVNDANAVSGNSIFGQAAVSEVISCGAIDVADFATKTIEYYSSQGPAVIAGQTRHVPFITGVDGVSVTGVGGFGSPFYGTSASSPHLAGVCALMLSKNPDATPVEIRRALIRGAVDAGAPGFDPVYGNGVCNALNAVLRLIPPNASASPEGWGLYR